ncbi:hypothetical protein B0H17DRAFT_1076066 [Mycena rosella]|uniref:Transmembrane protein n=1 Tax=Mycena rosella TaxID=1033263 RepID=A0AAD7G9W6_MYCRO|nr:hypothetical protein B0H17DRAFT_1076066 [Mycena rosella]
MDSDRKSTVSSFYGGRKGSLDALNQDFPSPTTGDYAAQQRPRGDDASSFFDPEQRRSTDPLAGRAGYNRGSFFQPGREEPLKGGRDEEDPAGPPDGAWDVYADFNNAGPKYSSAFGAQDTGYHSLGGGSTPKVEESAGPVELVTVPALGAEWKKSELRDMTKAGKRERQAESRRAWWRRFTRGDRAGRWRRITVFVCFALIVVIAIIVGICIPRVPSFAVSNATPLGNATGAWAAAVPTSFSRVPANFSFPAFADLQVDTDSNYLPLHFTRLRAQVFDLDSGFLWDGRPGEEDAAREGVSGHTDPD